MQVFKILGVVNRDDEYGIGFTTVTVTMPAKYWLGMKKLGRLGMLYGVDISNAVHREHGIRAYNPTVEDRKRSVKGIKTVTLTYYNAVPEVKPTFRLVQGGLR